MTKLHNFACTYLFEKKDFKDGVFRVSLGGCDRCSSDEVWYLKLFQKFDGSLRLNVDGRVECRCYGEFCDTNITTGFDCIPVSY